jgi:hypothetical protein
MFLRVRIVGQRGIGALAMALHHCRVLHTRPLPRAVNLLSHLAELGDWGNLFYLLLLVVV